MASRQNRYKLMQTYVSRTLFIDLALFILYLVFAGFGITWLKVIFSIFIILLNLCVILFLYMCGELLRKRSRWMSMSAAAILLCTLVSLILNYPSPV